MPITVTSRDSALTIALSGEIDHQVAREMMDSITDAIATACLPGPGGSWPTPAAPCGWSIFPPRRGGCWTPPGSGGSFP